MKHQISNITEQTHFRSRILKEETSIKINSILRKIVTTKEGTANFANIDGYQVGGKTGTAQLIIDGVYDNQRHLASFVGYFPADNPKYACIVIINDPQENGSYGGDVAAPSRT